MEEQIGGAVVPLMFAACRMPQRAAVLLATVLLVLLSAPAEAESPRAQPRATAAQAFATLALAVKDTASEGGLAGLAANLGPTQRPLLQRLGSKLAGKDGLWRLFFRSATIYIGNMASPAPVMAFYDPIGDALLLLQWNRTGENRWSLARSSFQSGAAFRAAAGARLADLPVSWLAEAAKGAVAADQTLRRAAAETARRLAERLPANAAVPAPAEIFHEPDASLAERYEFIAVSLLDIGSDHPQILAGVSALQGLVERVSPSPFDVLATPEALQAAIALRDALPRNLALRLEPVLSVIDRETGTGFVALSDARTTRLVVILYVDSRNERPIGAVTAVEIP